MRSIAKWLYRWLRRVHDIVAVLLVCLWVAGWFVNATIKAPPSTTLSIDAWRVWGIWAIDPDSVDPSLAKSEPGSLIPTYSFEVEWLDLHHREKTVELNKQLLNSFSAEESLIDFEVEPTHFFAEEKNFLIRVFSVPSTLIVLPFLIWPLGRLTHRIVKRKSADEPGKAGDDEGIHTAVGNRPNGPNFPDSF